MKDIECPACNETISMDDTKLNSGQECECPKCHGTFAKAQNAKADDDQYEIKKMGKTK
jgi:uncharacterized paraquat-inducible protein A